MTEHDHDVIRHLLAKLVAVQDRLATVAVVETVLASLAFLLKYQR
jgi:hypothetical protein